ncbi:hypothetical protein ALC62_01158 [Cyphomyrmex costatus]|uniref:DUF7041 domain-containing protein n=1 Tax=Cyphomyrmex costatus TaxID=456900 RepID=A0A151IPH4_9HYME|nr:hypothetical protein ALC62_01158 [Cyphomyrmex costatus]
MPLDRSPPPASTAAISDESTSHDSHSDANLPAPEPDVNQVATIKARQITLPPFYKQNPRLWFAQVELAFMNNNTSDVSKFRQLAAQLSGEVLDSVSDIILAPPRDGKYDAIKKRIVTAYDERDERRLRRLLRGNEMGDEKPTAYLHRLRNLATGQCSEPVLRSLFVEQLPDQIRTILTISDTQDLGCLAEMADKAMDIIKPSITTICIPEKTATANNSTAGESSKTNAINALTLQVEALAKKLKRFQSRRPRSRSRGR